MSTTNDSRRDHPYWINRGHLHDLFIRASGRKNIEIKKDSGCFSGDVCHPHDRPVSVAGLWFYSPRYALNLGQSY